MERNEHLWAAAIIGTYSRGFRPSGSHSPNGSKQERACGLLQDGSTKNGREHGAIGFVTILAVSSRAQELR